MVKTSKKAREKIPLSLISVILLVLAQVTVLNIKTYAATSLTLNISTENSIYGLSDIVKVNGSLTFNDTSVPDGLVAIEILDPKSNYFTFRTVKTGLITPINCSVNFTQLYPTDSQGTPTNTFKVGSDLYMYIEIKNYEDVSHKVIIAISVYDPDGIPIYVIIPSALVLEPKESTTIHFLAFRILTNLRTGIYTIFANAYSELLQNYGYPYCPERVVTFTVTSSTSGSINPKESTVTSEQANGKFSLSFKLPRIGRIGTYTIRAASKYQGQYSFRTMGFPVVLTGDIYEDGIVELMDFYVMSIAYNSKPGDPNWNKKCDIYPWPEGDDYIELMDFWLLSIHFGDQAVT